MGQIRDIMCKDVMTVEDDKSAADAAKIISDNKEWGVYGSGGSLKRFSENS